MEVNFYNIGSVSDERLKFAVVCSFYNDKLLLVKHKKRNTWEIPGGKRESFETINNAAERELFEETGAIDFKIKQICNYSVINNNNEISFGSLFYCEVKEIGVLPDKEIGEVKIFDKLPLNLTYPGIQPYLYNKVINYIQGLK